MAQKRGKHLRRVVCVLYLGALTGPREGETFSILEVKGNLFNTGLLLPTFEESTVCFVSGARNFVRFFYCIMFRVIKCVPFVWCQIGPGAKLTPVPN